MRKSLEMTMVHHERGMSGQMEAAQQPRRAALPHVVIVGAGFGGLQAARALRHTPVQVTVIDRSNHHLGKE